MLGPQTTDVGVNANSDIYIAELGFSHLSLSLSLSLLMPSVAGELICCRGRLCFHFGSFSNIGLHIVLCFSFFHGLLNFSDFAHEFPLGDWGYITHPGPLLMTCASKRVQTQRPSVYKEPFVSVLIYSERRPYCNFNPHTHTHTHTHTVPKCRNHTHVSLAKMYLSHFLSIKIPCYFSL